MRRGTIRVRTKLLITIVLLIVMMLTIVGCGGKTVQQDVDSTDSGDMSEWLENAELDKDFTIEELYENAKKEGKVVVYSMSSRIKTIKESFEKEYPGVTVEGYDMRMAEIFEKTEREHAAGLNNVDVLFVKDSDGAMVNEFMKTGILHKYIPNDIGAQIPQEYHKYAFAPYIEMKQVFYNTEAYEACPITNWWDLTKPEFKGKIMLANPISTAENMGLFMAMIQNADEMAAAYKEAFGEEIVLDGTENAGYEFMKRLAANDLILTNSDSEVVEAIGTPGQTNPPIGIAVSSKLRDRSKGLEIGTIYEMEPRFSVPAPAYLVIADHAPNVNAAKLFIRWVGGEADGVGEGLDPFRVVGSWPTNENIPTEEETPPLDTLNVWDLDLDFNYDHLNKINNFWISVLN